MTIAQATQPTPTARRARKATRQSFGSVRRLPSGRYQARYSDARMVRHTAPQTFATKKQAEDWLATTRADMVRGTWLAPELSTMTVADFIAAHLATRVDLAPKTQQMYASILRAWVAAPLPLPPVAGRRPTTVTIGDAQLGAVSIVLVREWYAAALHAAATRAAERVERHQARLVREQAVHDARAWARARGLPVSDTGRLPARVVLGWEAAGSPPAPVPVALVAAPAPDPDAGRASVAQAYRFLRMMFAHAVSEGRILANPCQIKGAGHIKHRERVPATVPQIVELADAMPPRYAAAVHVAAWSGLRAGELFGLARQHVDLTAGTVRVERAAIYLNGVPPYFGPTKTESSRRTVHLPAHVVEILRHHMATYTAPGAESLVFTDSAGRIVTREARLRAFWKARKAVGRPDLRWHDLRHTGATIAAHAGASLRELQHRLGHSTVHAAMVYQHATADRDRQIAERMDALAHL